MSQDQASSSNINTNIDVNDNGNSLMMQDLISLIRNQSKLICSLQKTIEGLNAKLGIKPQQFQLVHNHNIKISISIM